MRQEIDQEDKRVAPHQQWLRPCYAWPLRSEPGYGVLGGFPGVSVVKSHLPSWRLGFDLWVGKIPWRRSGNRTSMLAWRIPWAEETGGLQSMGLQKSQTHWATEQQARTSVDRMNEERTEEREGGGRESSAQGSKFSPFLLKSSLHSQSSCFLNHPPFLNHLCFLCLNEQVVLLIPWGPTEKADNILLYQTRHCSAVRINPKNNISV